MARGPLGMDEILESVGMVGQGHLDIRTVTLGINLRGCRTPEEVVRRVTTAPRTSSRWRMRWPWRPACRS